MPESREPSPKARSIALAYEWVARITAVALIMVLPGVAGRWLDVRFGTGFLALIGFAIGFCVGFAALLSMVNGNNNKQKSDVTSSRDLE